MLIKCISHFLINILFTKHFINCVQYLWNLKQFPYFRFKIQWFFKYEIWWFLIFSLNFWKVSNFTFLEILKHLENYDKKLDWIPSPLVKKSLKNSIVCIYIWFKFTQICLFTYFFNFFNIHRKQENMIKTISNFNLCGEDIITKLDRLIE
jgi:hypothetical protein